VKHQLEFELLDMDTTGLNENCIRPIGSDHDVAAELAADDGAVTTALQVEMGELPLQLWATAASAAICTVNILLRLRQLKATGAQTPTSSHITG